MRNVSIKIIYLLIIVFWLIGCTNNEASNFVERAATSNENQNDKSKLIIKGYYNEPESTKNKETVIIEGLSKGEFIEISIQGEIKDFEHVRIEWNETKKDLVEKETLNKFDKLTNQVIVINTYMPEGIPSEKIKWKSINGKVYEYIIQENNLGDESNKEQIFNLE
jgi:hypothetical protein